VIASALVFACAPHPAVAGIDNSGAVNVNVLDNITYGHTGAVTVTWSGTGGSGSVVTPNFDPGTRIAGEQIRASIALISCETVYDCPPGGRLTLSGMVTGAASDGAWQLSGGFYAQGLSCEDNYDFANAYFVWYVNLTASTSNLKPNDLKTCAGPDSDAVGMARASMHLANPNLNIEDTPLRYRPGRGPAIDFTVTYNEKGIQQSPNIGNLGPLWAFNWLSYVIDDPTNSAANVGVYVPSGGLESFSGFDQGVQSLADPQSHAVVVRTSTSPITYEKRFPDGSTQVFNLSDNAAAYPRQVYMTQWVDATGNAVGISYDSLYRITNLTDALGGVTTLAYEQADDPLKITTVTDPFGRFASFQYTNGLLTLVTDEIGLQSQFIYPSGSISMSSMTTPYGTTSFTRGQAGSNRWVEIADPLGGKERVEYRDNAPGILSSDPVAPNVSGIANSGLDVANTFYWDKKAMADAPGDYTKARITHWLYNHDGSVSGIPSSEKSALENRVWRTYPGQSDPTQVGPNANPSQLARVLGDGNTQLSQFEYNPIGKTTKATDPAGRVTSFVYDANNVDLLTVYQRNPAGGSVDPSGAAADKVASYTYNSLHEPLTATDAAGQTTVYQYDSYGQIQSLQNPKLEITTYGYGDGSSDKPIGYLTSITSPVFDGNSAVTTFLYDSMNRVRTVTDSDGYATTTDYDNLDRKTKIVYPDGTSQQFLYTDSQRGMTLDLTASSDRRGLWTYRHYDANRRMDSVTDPENRTTYYN